MKFVLAILITFASIGCFAADEPPRPHIIGLSHIALFVHDVELSRAFYKDLLGFAEPFSLTNKDGSLHLTWIKINDHQTIEIFPEKAPATDRLNHYAIETDDAEALRVYLAAKGIKVPDKTPVGAIGNANYMIPDPDGHDVEIVQYLPEGWTAQEKGNFLPDTRIATRMPHVGILVGQLEPARRFYEDILGFKETWRGSKSADKLSWVNLKVPDGKDYIEFMLYTDLPDPDKRGGPHHLCLEVPDVDKAKAILETRIGKVNYTKKLQIQTGVNRKRQLNLWDPDGTRVELMEPQTVDGVPAPPSTAPPPKYRAIVCNLSLFVGKFYDFHLVILWAHKS